MISGIEVLRGRSVKIEKLTQNRQVSVSEAVSLRGGFEPGIAAKPEPQAPRTRKRSKVSWKKRMVAAGVLAGALIAGGESANTSAPHISDTGTSSHSPTSLLAEASQTSGDRHISYTVQKTANDTHTERAEVGSYGSQTDAVSKVAEQRIEAAGIQNPSRNDILQVTTAIGSQTPAIQNLDVVQPHQELNVPDADAIRTMIKASHGESPDAELNVKAAKVSEAITTQGYNNARDEAGAVMTHIASFAETGTTGSVRQHESHVAAPIVPGPVSESATPAPTPVPTSEVVATPTQIAIPSTAPTEAPVSPSVEPTVVPEKSLLTSGSKPDSGNALFGTSLILGTALVGGVGYVAGRRKLGDRRVKQQRKTAEREYNEHVRRFNNLPYVELPDGQRTEQDLNSEFLRACQEITTSYTGKGTIFYTRVPSEVTAMLTGLGMPLEIALAKVEAAKQAMPSVEPLFTAEPVYSIWFEEGNQDPGKRTFEVIPTLVRQPLVAA